ncbi:MAG: trigger factor [Alphaproteobacteria bacterium]|nr:trigger factor [Alphaproteobacteria bacterium]
MQVTETKSEGLHREFKIAVPAKEIESRIGDRLGDIARTAHLPGFRPGKAPLAILKKKYGDAVRGEVLERAVNDITRQAMADRGLRPATQPNVEVLAFGEGKDLEYKVALDVLPEIKPMDFSALSLERMTVPVEEDKVTETLKRIASSRKTTKSAAASHKAAKGDVTVIDFVGRVGGNDFPGGKADGYSLELGSNSFVPGFEDQLVGAKAGDAITVKIAFPKEYAAEELAGKDAEFAVTVKEVRTAEPAAIDDELAKAVGLDSLETLKSRIRDEQGREYKEISRMRLKRALLDALHEEHDFDVPPTMVENEFQSIWAQFEDQRKREAEGKGEGGKPPKDNKTDNKTDDKSDDEHKEDFRAIAERRVRLGLLLAEIGRLNNIQVAQDDLNRALAQQAQRFPGQEQAVAEYFRGNPEAMQGLVGPILEEKVVDFILEMAKIKEKSVTLEELMKNDDDEEESSGKGKKKSAAKKKSSK